MGALPRVDWADEVETEGVLATARSMPAEPSRAQLTSMADQLTAIAHTLDVERARAAVSDAEPRALLGGAATGPFVALRWYVPGETSTVHHHAWTVISELQGDGELERWVLDDDGSPALHAIERLTAGRNAVIADGELHRQRAGAAGALELILIGDYSDARPQVDVLP